MTRLKNVRAGIVIIADAGLKLAPGESVAVDRLTAQTSAALDAGLLARFDSDGEGRSRPKSVPKPEERKQEPAQQDESTAPNAEAEDEGGAAAAEESKDAAVVTEVASGAKRGHK